MVREELMPCNDKCGESIGRAVGITSLVFYLAYFFLYSNSFCQSSQLFTSSIFKQHRTHIQIPSSKDSINAPTNISHIVFGIAGDAKTWRYRRPYVESWWRPNKTRGFVWLNRVPTEFPWPASSPPFRISEDTRRFKAYDRHRMPYTIRLARVIVETFREDAEDARWYVIADDDTIVFVDNLVRVLAKYDHNKYFYVGGSSECLSQNFENSFGMAFGGAGYAVSYPLARALAENVDDCLKRYQTVYGSDHIIYACVAELGVSLTRELGFHQIDLRGDILGLLSAHPQSPLISFHHLDYVEPIFPLMTRHESVKLLMNASKADPSRLLQQTICYNKQTNWTFSISWGYSAQIYEKIQLPTILRFPLQTFWPWKNTVKPPFVFNTRPVSRDPCEAPHFFFFESVDKSADGSTVTKYVRRSPRGLPACSTSGNHSADMISTIRVFSQTKRLVGVSTNFCFRI